MEVTFLDGGHDSFLTRYRPFDIGVDPIREPFDELHFSPARCRSCGIDVGRVVHDAHSQG
ncbi:hypothetical protein GCM10009673_26650 [Nesterenkonia sandarakina]